MATLYKANGFQKSVEPQNGTDFSLEELQGFVDGYIEIIYLRGSDIMVVNEEGRLKNLRINTAASFIAGLTIAGDVLVCKSKEVR